MKWLLVLIFTLMLSAVVLAQGEGLQTPAPQHPVTIPGTDMAWPKDDSACDDAWTAIDWKGTVTSCTKALTQYKDVIGVLKGTPGVKPGLIDLLQFNTAYTEYEIADALLETHHGKQGLEYAKQSEALFHAITDPIEQEPYKDVSETQSHVIVIFNQLLGKLHELYSEIPLPGDASI